jgi:hypothetical protein
MALRERYVITNLWVCRAIPPFRPAAVVTPVADDTSRHTASHCVKKRREKTPSPGPGYDPSKSHSGAAHSS